jgi:hypothetical protein
MAAFAPHHLSFATEVVTYAQTFQHSPTHQRRGHMMLADLIPFGGTAAGSGGATFAVTRWWAYRLQARKQSDDVLGGEVARLQARVIELETIVRQLEHELRNSATEADSMFWLLKYAPEERRAEAVADLERARRERRARKAEERQAAQRALAAERTSHGRKH